MDVVWSTHGSLVLYKDVEISYDSSVAKKFQENFRFHSKNVKNIQRMPRKHGKYKPPKATSLTSH